MNAFELRLILVTICYAIVAWFLYMAFLDFTDALQPCCFPSWEAYCPGETPPCR